MVKVQKRDFKFKEFAEFIGANYRFGIPNKDKRMQDVANSWLDSVERLYSLASFPHYVASVSAILGHNQARAIHEETGEFTISPAALQKQKRITRRLMAIRSCRQKRKNLKKTSRILKLSARIAMELADVKRCMNQNGSHADGATALAIFRRHWEKRS